MTVKAHPQRLVAPITVGHLHDRYPWVVPAVGALFVLLAIGAKLNWLVWDAPITRAAIDARTSTNVAVAKEISFLGSTTVVIVVACCGALAALPRSRRLALAILVIAAVRPLVEWSFKELVGRARPPFADRLVVGTGPSFPSGHPLATAASWCLIPLVVELYTRRRVIWWISVTLVWALAVAVGWTRVWLAVHWTSDVIAALALAGLGVAAAEWAMTRASVRPGFQRRSVPPDAAARRGGETRAD